MNALIRTILRKNLSKLIVYTVINIGLVWLFVALFPQIQEDSDQLTDLFNAYPEDFLKAFGVEGTTLFSDFESFLALEYFSIMWPILVLAFVISFAGSAFSGEIEKGTMDVLLSLPLSRFKIFLSKFIAGVVLVTIVTLSSGVFAVLFATIYGIDFKLEGFYLVAIIGELFGLACLSVSLIFSSIFSTDGKAMSISLFLVIAMYVIKIVSELNVSLENIKYLSLFYYYDYNAALLDHKLPVFSVIVFSIIIIISTVASLVYFLKRDIAT